MDFPFPLVLVIIYSSLNLLAFAVFSYDKLKAKVRLGRNSENHLLFVAALGPFGALVAMGVFRHKIRHVKFILVSVFCILQLFLIIWLWPRVVG
jgi:uncharacterized membrane protein YsdA (DUF1294 family)